jgi:hypothetical protein
VSATLWELTLFVKGPKQLFHLDHRLLRIAPGTVRVLFYGQLTVNAGE